MTAGRQGLFAFVDDTFYHLFQDTPQLDHGGWFAQIGLPNHGPAFDAILRGKVSLDVDTDAIVVGYYGAAYLSTRRYTRIIEAFEIDEALMVERRLHEPY